MTNFFYKAINPETKVEISDNIEADSPRVVREYVRSLGLLPIIVREQTSSENKTFSEQIPIYKGSKINLNISDKIYFFSQLHTMFAAGLTLTNALESIAQHAPNSNIKTLAQNIEIDIRNGKSFTESVKKYHQSLGETAIGLCLTAEAAGQLDDVMGKITDLLKKEKLIRSKLSTIMIYPAIMSVLCIGMFFICGLFIIPKLMEAFFIDKEKLTGALKFIYNSCNFCAENWFIILICLVSTIVIVKKILKAACAKKMLDNLAMNLPILNECTRYLNLSPFFAVLGLAYDAGLTIPSSIEMAANSISNSKLRNDADKIVDFVVNGSTLSKALAETNFVSPTFNALVVAGEQSGDLGKMFNEISNNITQNIDDVTAKLLEVIKLAVIIIVGIFVLLLAPALQNAANLPIMGF